MTIKEHMSTILKVAFLLSTIFFISCDKHNIDELKNEKVKFEDLPVEISTYLKNPTEAQSDIQSMLLELPKGEEPKYKLETINTWIGPWVDYTKLIDLERNIYYKIDQGVPSPYIVFNGELYIPNEYNIFTTVEDLRTLEFDRYKLK